ncbi:hypothetical protein Plav_0420 [Parvibaculum lavamentivorans DS-1]|uniref:DUF4412 domain-containing protein n=1 Tax=Parvibaculum lavamentivorans (strain DS-1 / DSM 13023 / NCIMB 13966) TaxID=402881 RepID=A7HQ60_PARL1|nr:hypothetical protein Plav_0420 [Parvibaculum lavamentivorans DS-1]
MNSITHAVHKANPAKDQSPRSARGFCSYKPHRKRLSVRSFVFSAFAAALLFAGQPASAVTLTPPDTGYSATRIVNASGREISGQLYSENGNERWEMTMQGMRQVSILRHGEGRMFLYMPDMNMAMEMGQEEAANYGVEKLLGGVEAEEIGRETVEGEATTKYRVLPGQTAQKGDATIWVTEDGIPVKAEGSSAQGNFSMRLTNLQRGPQDPGLFELPAGVSAMKMPQGMPGGTMPGMPLP